jgi:hypothetical protein
MARFMLFATCGGFARRERPPYGIGGDRGLWHPLASL